MDCSEDLSADELSGLKAIAKRFVSADYWEDETVKRYRERGLIYCDGPQIRPTDAGKIMCADIGSRPTGAIESGHVGNSQLLASRS